MDVTVKMNRTQVLSSLWIKWPFSTGTPQLSFTQLYLLFFMFNQVSCTVLHDTWFQVSWADTKYDDNWLPATDWPGCHHWKSHESSSAGTVWCTYELYKLYLVSVNHRATVSSIRFTHVHSACSGSHWWTQHCHVPSCIWSTDPVRSTPGLGLVSFCSVCAVGLISFLWIADTCTQSKAAGPG